MNLLDAEVLGGQTHTYLFVAKSCLKDIMVDVIIKVVVVAMVLEVSNAALEEEPRCNFPIFLQTPDTKAWLLNHTDTLRTHYINGGVLTAFDCRKENRECSEYKRLCWKAYSHNRFLVKHLESDFYNRFLCIQFVQRSISVVQVKLSNSWEGDVGKYLCNVEKLDLAPWPWISEQHFASSSTTCPFVGGYNFDLYTFSDYISYQVQRKCAHAMPPVRVESDCEDGEGMTFKFRSSSCLHNEGNFDVVQNTKCIASWTEGKEHFGVLSKESDRYFWCIRVKFGDGNEVARIIIFLDLTCEHTMNFTKTKRYIELEILEKRKVTHMCTDVYYGCEVMNELCTVLSDLCAKTCGSCNASHKATPCDFPNRIHGTWLRSGLEQEKKHLRNKNSQVEILPKVIRFPESGEYECVTFQEKVRSLRRVILRRFHNGCYPRFMCMHYDRPAPSVMRLRLGNLKTWPTKLSDDSICDAENFMTYPDVRQDIMEAFYRPFESMIKLASPLQPISCNLPGRFPKALTVYDDYGVTSCLIHGAFASPRDMILIRLRNGSLSQSKRYTCIGSLTFIGSYKSIITVTQDNPQEYLCWIIVSHNYILQVPPSSCNTVTANFIMEGKKQFEKRLIRSYFVTTPTENSSSVCEEHFNEHYAYKPHWRVMLPLVDHASYTSPHLFCIFIPIIKLVMS